MKKKIKDFTLEELHNICESQNSCQECPIGDNLCQRAKISDVLAYVFHSKTKVEIDTQDLELEVIEQ